MERNDRPRTEPQSPEGYPEPVREELDQEEITHEGVERPAEGVTPGDKGYMGAEESDVQPTTPPMDSPEDLIGEVDDEEDVDDEIDPRDELTPG